MKRVLVYLGFVLLLSGLLLASCSENQMTDKKGNYDWAEKRAAMVQQLRVYGIEDEQTLKAMNTVWRHKFIPEEYLGVAPPYGDHPCPIGYDQTISQPYIVAYMFEGLGGDEYRKRDERNERIQIL